MSTYDRTQETLIALLFAAILCVIGVKACADAFGLPWKTMLQEILATLTVVGLAVASWLYGYDWRFSRLSVAWPALLGLLFFAWWPALDAWNTVISLPSLLDYDQSNYVVKGDAFWDAMWFRWGILAVCGAGYGWLYKREAY